ncbi:filamin-A isoform X2 [Drosophila novamexicana]|uniref:filamin-A isoform X2 n=1 Tax=Drosophila novamexicana TaxID=47314 RepID=UPI0011E5F2A4|nr:filamin-A isoform X2 [Drosophila novamexicana]
MFKVSQEIRLNTSAAGALGQGQGLGDASDGSSPESVCVFGRYQRTPDADAYPTEPPRVYIAPELTDASKVQLLHLPSGAVRINSTVSFIIKRNGVKGNFDVRLESPSGQHGAPLQLTQLDPERFQVQCQLPQAGLYKVHIKCNSVPLPKSPYIIVTIAGVPPTEDGTDPATCSPSMPVFESDASKVHSRGLGLTHVNLLERNEFTVDGSAAGSNMLFVGILGAQGPCDEVLVKHLGRHVYRVMYQVREPGEYILVAKWGEQHIPGSPFSLTAD